MLQNRNSFGLKVFHNWGDPGVSEMMQIQETPISYPTLTGGQVIRTLQRSGFLNRLRFQAKARLSTSAFTTAPGKSPYGILGAFINRIRVEANGQIPLVDLSGIGVTMYNDVQNRDGSSLAPVPFDTTNDNVAAGASLKAYPAIGGTGNTDVKAPFEFQFALPVNIKQQVTELGLWLLQNQAIDVGVNVTMNALYNTTASTRTALYSGGTLTTAADLANTGIDIERELYTIPNNESQYPDLAWAHQVVELTQTFTGNFSRFAIPRAGLLLRVLSMTLDGNGDPVEYTDISDQSWIYGANERPIARPGRFFTQEFLQDYGHYPQKGMTVMDFYKFGWSGLKFVKSTEDLANLRIETTYGSTSAGTQIIVLDRLIPVSGR